MNVLFISNWYPSSISAFSGIFIKEHAQSVKIASKDVNLVVMNVLLEKSGAFFTYRIDDFLDETGIRTVQLILSSRYKNVLYYLPWVQYAYFKKVFFTLIYPAFKPDIIHGNVVYTSGIIAHKLSRKLKVPFVITEHWSKLKYMFQKPFLSNAITSAYRKSANILPVSDYLKSEMIAQIPELKENRFTVVPNIGDSALFHYQPKLYADNTIRFCAVATWAIKREPDKFPELFIEALEVLQHKIPQKIILTIIGGGDRVEELKKMCAEKSYETRFLGFLSKNAIAEELHRTHYFLHASRMETFCIVALEGLLTGTPVICSNVGALPELVNKTNGILCENTVEDWVEAIQKAFSVNFDNEKIAEDVNEKYGKETVGKQIYAVYANA